MRKITIADMIQLPPQKANFVVEYVKDFSARRAAEASGFAGDSGYTIREQPEVSAAIELIIQQRLDANMIDADWILYEMVDNHMIARQQGNITASNTALSMVAKHKRVDAFAADKIMVSTDADVMDRLIAGRQRMNRMNAEDEISFL